MSFLFSNPLQELINKATSEDLPPNEPDLSLNFEIADQIRSKQVTTKDALNAIRKRIDDSAVNIQSLALQLLDVCVKNGGHHFLVEVSSKEFIDSLVGHTRSGSIHSQTRKSILTLIQQWAIAFKGKYELAYVENVYNSLKEEGVVFPQVVVSSALFETFSAPEWKDSDVCFRCRSAFTFTNRKHHCRNCGQVFCNSCSSKVTALPHFGVSQEVRVCDGCFVKLNSPSTARKVNVGGEVDDELKRVLELSLAETQSKEVFKPQRVRFEEEDDVELKRAIEESLKEAQKKSASVSSTVVYERAKKVDLPQRNDSLRNVSDANSQPQNTLPLSRNQSVVQAAVLDDSLTKQETDNILSFHSQMESTVQRGQPVYGDAHLQYAYDQVASLHQKLMKQLDRSVMKCDSLFKAANALNAAIEQYDQFLKHPIPLSLPMTSNSMDVRKPSLQPTPPVPMAPPALYRNDHFQGNNLAVPSMPHPYYVQTLPNHYPPSAIPPSAHPYANVPNSALTQPPPSYPPHHLPILTHAPQQQHQSNYISMPQQIQPRSVDFVPSPSNELKNFPPMQPVSIQVKEEPPKEEENLINF